MCRCRLVALRYAVWSQTNTDTQTHRHTDTQTDTHADKETDRHKWLIHTPYDCYECYCRYSYEYNLQYRWGFLRAYIPLNYISDWLISLQIWPIAIPVGRIVPPVYRTSIYRAVCDSIYLYTSTGTVCTSRHIWADRLCYLLSVSLSVLRTGTARYWSFY